MKNSSFARFAHAFFILNISQSFLNVLSTTWNDMFCSYVDDVSTWRQFLVFSFLSAAPLGRSDQFNSRIVSKHFQAKRLGIIEEPDFKNTESIQMTLILAVVDVVLASAPCFWQKKVTETFPLAQATSTCTWSRSSQFFYVRLKQIQLMKYQLRMTLSKEHFLACLSFHSSFCIIN